MAYLYLALFCLVHNLQAIPAPGHGILAGYCQVSAHCAVDECCVSFSQPRGKRTALQSLSPELLALVDGTCQKRGVQNSNCIVDDGTSPGVDGLYYDCPCNSGLVCKGTGQQVLNKGELGVCLDASSAKATTLNQPCSTGDDCGDTECCVSDVRPIGKKRQSHGHCQGMRGVGDGCLVRYASGKPHDVVFQCPCSASLKCNGTGQYDIPLGEIGKCV